YSIKQGSVDIVECLVRHRADVNTPTKAGMSPLNAAACENHVDTVELLLSRGAAFNSAAIPAIHMLDAALANGQLELFSLLVHHPAITSDRTTPLHWAIQFSTDDTVRLLIEHGADLEAWDSFKMTPVRIAALAGDQRERSCWLNMELTSNEGETILTQARVHGGHLDTVRVLVEAGANTQAVCEDGKTPLEHAESNGHSSTVLFLLDWEKRGTRRRK
ncbi:ankyrin repeat-containing domain protein, partial [Zopfochytrium polystomum]